MKTLIVEDDFISRKILKSFIEPYGECDIAVNGKEAIQAIKHACQTDDRYSLVMLDIMMPEMDGRETLQKIRDIEKDAGRIGLDGVKIIMTTSLKDYKNVLGAFRDGADGYLVKPYSKEELHHLMEKLELA